MGTVLGSFTDVFSLQTAYVAPSSTMRTRNQGLNLPVSSKLMSLYPITKVCWGPSFPTPIAVFIVIYVHGDGHSDWRAMEFQSGFHLHFPGG